MGMYDYVRFETTCPSCGKKVSNFQSKDGGCFLGELDFWEVNNFYAVCGNCETWIEYNRKKPQQTSPIEDYEMTFSKRDKSIQKEAKGGQ